MRIVSIGGGPSGLYFAILMKQADPAHQVEVRERNRPDDTFGFGVVFSDATLSNLAREDAPTHARIIAELSHWDDIDIHIGGEVVTSTGHGFCGIERRRLLEILQDRCRELDVALRFETEVTDVDAVRREADLVLGADGVASRVREIGAAAFGPAIDLRPNRFVWLGTTFPFRAFTFYFTRGDAGLFRVHAYRYAPERSTFIVECTADTFERTGLAPDDEDATIAYLERVFERELAGHPLIKNRSIWRQFPTVRNQRWHDGNLVLVGDAAHTAHFSIGSGTKLAMEDAISLRDEVVRGSDMAEALARYEAARRPAVESLQRAAQVSLEWFEGTERYMKLPPLAFAFSLLTRSLRVSHGGLRRRDPALVDRVDTAFAAAAGAPPMLPHQVPLRVRDLVIPGRVVRRFGGEIPTGTGLVVFDAGATGAVAAIHAAGAVACANVVVGGAAPDAVVLAVAAAVADGADAVEIDAGPGSVRTDLVEVVRAVRDWFRSVLPSGSVPPWVLAVRISAANPEAAVALARDLAAAGVDTIGVAGELTVCDRIRNEAGVLAIAEGSVRSVDDVDSALAAMRADLFRITS